MPAAPIPRQAEVSAWFDTQAARLIQQLEQQHLRERLQMLPSQPWLWFGPTATWAPPALPARRGVRLHNAGDGPLFDGDLRCGLPLPLPAEAVNAIVIQHADPTVVAELIAECSRVLMPGGRIWMTHLNPCSPYRIRWRRQGVRPASVSRCRALLQGEGLQCVPARYLGPLWTDLPVVSGSALPPLRAVCVLEAEKRVVAATGPGKVPVAWGGPVTT